MKILFISFITVFYYIWGEHQVHLVFFLVRHMVI